MNPIVAMSWQPSYARTSSHRNYRLCW